VILNDEGEYTGYTYEDIATFVAGGGVWIDGCGWPMATTNTGPFGQLGDFPANFDHLVEALNSPMGYNEGPPSFSAVPQGFPYPRSLVVTGQPESKGFVVNQNAPQAQDGNNYVYSSFAIKYQKGAYIYAFGNDNAYGSAQFFGVNANPGVPFSTYWPFVQSIVQSIVDYRRNQTSGPGCSGVGSYKGETNDGNFVYEGVLNGKLTRTIVDSYCTPVSVQVLSGGTSSPTQTPGSGSSTSSPTSGRGLCVGVGSYMGPGNDFGSSAEYDVYKVDTSTGYIYNLVDPSTCTVVHQFSHTTSPTSTGASSGSSGGVSVSQGGKGTSTASAATVALTSGEKTALLIAGGVAVAGVGYYLLTRGGGER